MILLEAYVVALNPPPSIHWQDFPDHELTRLAVHCTLQLLQAPVRMVFFLRVREACSADWVKEIGTVGCDPKPYTPKPLDP